MALAVRCFDLRLLHGCCLPLYLEPQAVRLPYKELVLLGPVCGHRHGVPPPSPGRSQGEMFGRRYRSRWSPHVMR